MEAQDSFLELSSHFYFSLHFFLTSYSEENIHQHQIAFSLYFNLCAHFHWIQMSFAVIPVGASLGWSIVWPAGAQQCPGSWRAWGVCGVLGEGRVLAASWLSLRGAQAAPDKRLPFVFEMLTTSHLPSKFKCEGGLMRQLSYCLMGKALLAICGQGSEWWMGSDGNILAGGGKKSHLGVGNFY